MATILNTLFTPRFSTRVFTQYFTHLFTHFFTQFRKRALKTIAAVALLVASSPYHRIEAQTPPQVTTTAGDQNDPLSSSLI